MKSLEIVTHVFAGKIDAYAFHLLYQASSLLWHPPQADVTLTVFWSGPEHDPHTANVVEHIRKRRWDVSGDPTFVFQPIILTREQLFRRCIGRHIRSQECTSDLIWYCDADMAMGEGCIDYLCEHVRDDGKLYGPRRTLINLDWQVGDAMVEAAGDWPRIDPDKFKWQRNKVLIGGIQVLGRETAKRLGYLGEEAKWSKPGDPDRPFPCFRDDSVWRRKHFPMEKQMQRKLEVPNIYRLRHSKSSLRPEGIQLTNAPAAAQ